MKCCPSLIAAGLVAASVFSSPSSWAQASTNEVIRGPVFSGTVRGRQPNAAIAMKGIVVTTGSGDQKAYFCYDADLMRLSQAWTGGYLEFGNTLNQIAWPPPPQVRGTAAFGVKQGPGWGKGGSFADPRANEQGPLPKDWAHYEGMYMNGDRAVLKYRVGKAVVLETPDFEVSGQQPLFRRTFQFEKSASDLDLCLLDGVESTLSSNFERSVGPVLVQLGSQKSVAVSGVNVPAGAKLEVAEGRLILKLKKVPANKPFSIVLSTDAAPAGFVAARERQIPDLRAFTKGGPARWTEPVVTKGTLGAEDDAYVVDTITEPVSNPYNAKTFFGGFDFFADGRAAICTFHGDVWIVSGIDDKLENLTWKRYATGLFQPLGVKIVKDALYVLGRDQITRLHDLNKDGEADYYENFNNDVIVTANYHEFSLDLHTDTQGNFYYAKGAPWEPEVTSPHQGAIIKVSKDGSKLEVYATGLRAPNGMTVGPKNQITVSDNQGHWMPASKLNWVEKGGFYGMTPAAQRELQLVRGGTNFTANPSDPKARAALKFKGWDAASPMPAAGYDEPISWLPMNADNSSGGQVWAATSKWGPLQDKLLFMSYGKCTLFEVMLDEVDGEKQAAMVQFPLKFYSGLMRGRVHPKDGQVYVSGLKGWQSSATRDGGFYRVRYTGKPVKMPTSFKARKNGIEIGFASPLSAKSAADAGNYSIERWNYVWSGAYGSPEFSVTNPQQKKHDRPEVKAARVSADGKTVILEIDDMQPCDQIKVRYSVDAADGSAITQEIYGTVHRLGGDLSLK